MIYLIFILSLVNAFLFFIPIIPDSYFSYDPLILKIALAFFCGSLLGVALIARTSQNSFYSAHLFIWGIIWFCTFLFFSHCLFFWSNAQNLEFLIITVPNPIAASDSILSVSLPPTRQQSNWLFPAYAIVVCSTVVVGLGLLLYQKGFFHFSQNLSETETSVIRASSQEFQREMPGHSDVSTIAAGLQEIPSHTPNNQNPGFENPSAVEQQTREPGTSLLPAGPVASSAFSQSQVPGGAAGPQNAVPDFQVRFQGLPQNSGYLTQMDTPALQPQLAQILQKPPEDLFAVKTRESTVTAEEASTIENAVKKMIEGAQKAERPAGIDENLVNHYFDQIKDYLTVGMEKIYLLKNENEQGDYSVQLLSEDLIDRRYSETSDHIPYLKYENCVQPLLDVYELYARTIMQLV